jgi:hypothetical protein
MSIRQLNKQVHVTYFQLSLFGKPVLNMILNFTSQLKHSFNLRIFAYFAPLSVLLCRGWSCRGRLVYRYLVCCDVSVT